MSVYKILLLSFFLVSCGGDSNNSNDNTNSTGLSGINGIITFQKVMGISGSEGVSFKITKGMGSKKTTSSINGKYPYRHTAGDIIFAEECGFVINLIVIEKNNGQLIRVSPCSDNYKYDTYNPVFYMSKLSRDRKKVAAVLETGDGSPIDEFETLVYDLEQDNKLIARFKGYVSPEWLDDGRLLVSPDHNNNKKQGLYLTDKDITTQNLTRLDLDNDRQIVGPAYNANISPSGDKIIFEYNNSVYQIGVDGRDLIKLFSSSSKIKYPTWSPDGKYIAYLTRSGRYYNDRAIYFHELETKKEFKIDTYESDILGIDTPEGPLSWSYK